MESFFKFPSIDHRYGDDDDDDDGGDNDGDSDSDDDKDDTVQATAGLRYKERRGGERGKRAREGESAG